MRRLSRFLLALVLGLFAAGCKPDGSPENDTRGPSVRDGTGRTVVMPLHIQRIVPLSPSVTEMVFAAGAGDLVAGVSLADDFPPEVADLPRFSAYPLDLEAIVSLDPDLVIASDQVSHPGQTAALERLGIPSYFLASQSVREIPEMIRRIGTLFDSEAHAARTADSLEQRIDTLTRLTDRLRARPDVLVLAGADPLFSFGTESYIHELVEMAGGHSVTASLSTATPILSDEFVLRSMPDVIIGTDSLFNPASILHLHPTWDVVPAVAHGRVYAIDPDLIYRPGPRLVEGAFRIARFLHPHLKLPSSQ